VTSTSEFVTDLAETESRIAIYASTTGREVSQENDAWGRGAFAKALIEAVVERRADVLHQGVITTDILDLYLSVRVKEPTGGSQHPAMARPPTVPDFAVFGVNAIKEITTRQ
jgi:hypothetical protein